MKKTLTRLRNGAIGVALSALALSGIGLTPAAAAAAQDEQSAEGRFLDLDDLLLGLDLNPVANLDGHYQGLPSAPGKGSSPLDLAVLSGLLDLKVGATVLPLQELITLGAANQMAEATNAPTTIAASGLVTDDGAISVGTGGGAGDASIDLSKLLGSSDLAGVNTGTGLVEELKIELKAVAARAAANPSGIDSDYNLSGAKLTVKSKTVGTLVSSISTSTKQLEDTLVGGVNATLTLLDAALSTLLTLTGAVVNPLLAPNVAADGGAFLGLTKVKTRVNLFVLKALDDFLKKPLTSSNGAVALNLSTGEVIVDLSKVVRKPGDPNASLNLNGFEASHELLDKTTIDGIVAGLEEIVDQLGTNLGTVLTDALKKTSVSLVLTADVIPDLLKPTRLQPRGKLVTTVTINLLDNTPTVSYEGSGLKDKNGNVYEPKIDEAGVLALVAALVDGTVKPLLQTLTKAVQKLLDQGAINTLVEPLTSGLTTLIRPLLKVLQDVVSLKVNYQPTPGKFIDERGKDESSFTVKAIRVAVLPTASKPLLQLGLAGATVTPLNYTPTITLDKPTAEPLDTVTVSGTGFAPNESVTVTFPDGSTKVVVADDQGALPGGITWTIPEAQADGKVTITAHGVVSGKDASTELTVKRNGGAATLAADPTTLTLNEGSSQLTATGFKPGETVTITRNGDTLTSGRANDRGEFTYDWPAGALGEQTFKASGAASGKVSNEVTVTVKEALKPVYVADKAQVKTGESVTFTGSGFAPNDELTFTGGPFAGAVHPAMADENGAFSFTWTVPAGQPLGQLTSTVDGKHTPDVAPASVEVILGAYGVTLKADKAQVRTGEPVKLTAEGFTRDGVVDVVKDGQKIGEATVTGGQAEYTWTPDTAGMVSFVATGQDTTRSTTAVPVRVAPHLAVAGPGYPGHDVDFSGHGFVPGEKVLVVLPQAAPFEVTADGEGKISGTITLPATQGTVPVLASAFGTTSQVPGADMLEVKPLPTITLNPSEGKAGSTTQVSGANFTPSENVTVNVGGTDLGPFPVSADGTFGPVDVAIPQDAQTGTVKVTANDGKAPEASADFTVIKTYTTVLAADPGKQFPGRDVTISGGGFEPAEQVRVSVGDGVFTKTVTAGDDGTIEVVWPVPADQATGEQKIIAEGAVSKAPAGAKVTIVALPALSVDPAEGPAGSEVTVTGGGFKPNAPVEITIGGQPAGTVETDGTGTIKPNQKVTVPEGVPGGSTEVVANDGSSPSAKDDFKVTGSFTIAPNRGQRGDGVTIEGSGFAPNTELTITIGGGTVTEKVTTDANGAFGPVVVKVPADAAIGAGDATVEDNAGEPVTRDFIVDEDEVTPTPAFTIDPSGKVGDKVTLEGSGFAPATELTITIGGGTVTEKVTTDANGAFGPVEVAVPDDAKVGTDEGATVTDGRLSEPVTQPFEVLPADSTDTAQADATSDASASAASQADAGAAAVAAANANNDDQAQAEGSSQANANTAAAAQAAAIADASTDASKDATAEGSKDSNGDDKTEGESDSTADANADNESDSQAAADTNANATADDNNAADDNANASSAADGTIDVVKATVELKKIERNTGVKQTVTGTGFKAGETVDATLHSTPRPLGTQKADQAGTVTWTFEVDADVELGDHYVDVMGAESGKVLKENRTTDFVVVDKDASGSKDTGGSTDANGDDDAIDVGGVQTSRPVDNGAASSGSNSDADSNGGPVTTYEPTPSNPDEQLSNTGAPGAVLGVGLLALLLLMAGAALMVQRRRRHG